MTIPTIQKEKKKNGRVVVQQWMQLYAAPKKNIQQDSAKKELFLFCDPPSFNQYGGEGKGHGRVSGATFEELREHPRVSGGQLASSENTQERWEKEGGLKMTSQGGVPEYPGEGRGAGHLMSTQKVSGGAMGSTPITPRTGERRKKRFKVLAAEGKALKVIGTQFDLHFPKLLKVFQASLVKLWWSSWKMSLSKKFCQCKTSNAVKSP